MCSLLIASAIQLGPVDTAGGGRNINYFDRLIRVTERVLDRSICPDIERTHAADKDDQADVRLTEKQKEILRDKAEVTKAAARAAVERHCKNSPRVKGKNAAKECNLLPRTGTNPDLVGE